MARLNYDCLMVLFENFIDEPDGYGLLYNCALLNREWRTIADSFLYADPWKYWLYRSKNYNIAIQLIDTYMMCYNTVNLSSHENEGGIEEVRPQTRIRIEAPNNRNNDRIPLYDYIAFAKNLHIPSLYQCISLWYNFYHEEEREENDRSIYHLFLKIFELFVDRARIKECTFAESTEDNKYPVTLDQLNRLINQGHMVDLKYLNFGFFQCNSDGLTGITGKCDKLKTFKISAQKCSDEALENFIRTQKSLTKLKIRNAEKINLTLDALETQSSSLVKLRILSCNLKSCETPFNGIAACSKLRSIYMRKIIDWPRNVSPSTLLMPMAQNCEFHNVDFSNTYLPVDVLVEIAKKSSTTLRRVYLIGPENQVDDEFHDLSSGINALGSYAKNIHHFERDILPREINSMVYLLSSVGNSLIRLEIESRFMISYDASIIISTIGDHCPKLELLNIDYFNFTTESFERLIQGCQSLTSLSICNSKSVNEYMLNIIRDLAGENLRSLCIYGCDQVSLDAVENLRDETHIEVDTNIEVDDEGL
ncbi:16354_t:CDS:2 [Funneliformis geosporum]|uniref:4044_t:CDS:1 n=1 Tax=Funneliformis geosporum TaxID=1117311 RepID=A0A9W4SSC8_9GLOM|nr:4044_t:CDS:2 [Funneliformis geosporum]CAI2181775.1 16354_t:CDS:2 [Funneliformis geosporum]